MLLMQYHWPGNVRELRSLVNKLVIFAEKQMISPEDINREWQILCPETVQADYYQSMTAYERDLLTRALVTHDWNVAQTAKSLGLERTNLHKKCKS